MPNSPDEDLQALFLKYVDRLTDLQIKVSTFCYNPEEFMEWNKLTESIPRTKANLKYYLAIAFRK